MPRLGLGFGTNGGYFGFWKENSDRDLSTGLPLCGPFRAAHSTSQSVQVLRAAIQGLDEIPLPAFLKKWLRRNAFIVALGKDNNNGVMTFNRGKFKVVYNKAESHVYHEIDNEIREIKTRTGTRIYSPSAPITVQPLGGACLGTSVLDGVIGANGEVFDNPGLYIADAAALPASGQAAQLDHCCLGGQRCRQTARHAQRNVSVTPRLRALFLLMLYSAPLSERSG